MTYTSIAAANRQRQRQEHPPTSHYYYPASTHQHPKTAFTRYETQNSPYTKVSEKHVPSADGHREEPMSVDVTASPLSNLTLQTPTATTFPRETESATPAFAHPLTSMTHSSSTPPTDSKSKHNGNGAMPLTNIIHRPLTAFLDGSRGESSSSAPGAGSSSHYRWTHPH
ncbi:hypothetical protein BCR43DRAFT_489128 [Syncephalastrum racemosum]|uniref:Uncharacterized protein n=1 Tax=Syncephalastrum racemosum TaxID=13706 RepID=A0A1X2HJQ8_SYNRA|nr:hypothetical protein BCR43DRAFT_489128 [Syncephalastrum racemosum]